jgi:hypothetical protein
VKILEVEKKLIVVLEKDEEAKNFINCDWDELNVPDDWDEERILKYDSGVVLGNAGAARFRRSKHYSWMMVPRSSNDVKLPFGGKGVATDVGLYDFPPIPWAILEQAESFFNEVYLK